MSKRSLRNLLQKLFSKYFRAGQKAQSQNPALPHSENLPQSMVELFRKAGIPSRNTTKEHLGKTSIIFLPNIKESESPPPKLTAEQRKNFNEFKRKNRDAWWNGLSEEMKQKYKR